MILKEAILPPFLLSDFKETDDSDETDYTLSGDDMPEKNERPCSADPQGEAVIRALDAELDAFYNAIIDMYVSKRAEENLRKYLFE